MSVAENKETLGFQTEVQQLLKLMIHSLYSHKEIFLRELISNASDALDKLRFCVLKDEAYQHEGTYQIRIEVDPENRLLIIEDNGIGMDHDEVIQNLGTIAKSGTKSFLDNLSGDTTHDSQLIGQFGVGFYSAFMVAERVTVETRRANQSPDQGVRWQSTGEGEYTVEPMTKSTVGTRVVLVIKPEEKEFLQSWRLRSIVQKYSDHIAFPVLMKKDPVPASESDAQSGEASETVIEAAPIEEAVNRATALWLRPKKEITEDEYQEFYKHIAHDYEKPLGYMHNRVEGKQEYTSLLYIPAHPPFNLWQQNQKYGLKLYINRVFILDDVEQFLPVYLRFMRGVVDAQDLPLNVSREMLQKTPAVDNIRGALVKRTLDLLESLVKKEDDTYPRFWKQFGNVLKEGPAEDFSNRERIANLLRFASTHTDVADQTVSLQDYLQRMKPDQEKIYYVTAESFLAAKNSPYLEKLREAGIEALLLFDRIDEWLMSHLNEYAGKSFQAVHKGDLDLGKLEAPIDAEQQKSKEEAYQSVVAKATACLGDRVKSVRLSTRLKSTPACVVVDEDEMGLQLQRMMKAAGQAMPAQRPIFELNPDHALVSRLRTEEDTVRFDVWINLLFDEAVLAESGHLEDPAVFVQRLNGLLLSAKFE